MNGKNGWAARWRAPAVFVCCLLAAPACAERVLYANGRIVTLDAQSRIARDMLVEDERIVALADDASLRDRAARIVDLRGRVVIPGLIDSHIHAIRAGLSYARQADWSDVPTLHDALERLRATAASLPPGAWVVVAGGWNAQQFAERRAPTQAEIAEAAGDRPAYVQMSYTGVLMNERGRARLGLRSDADLPAGARFERDAQGRATGWILGDLPSVVDLYERLPKPSLNEAKEGTQRFFRALNARGVTGVSDPGGHNLALSQYAAVRALAADKALTIRLRYSLCAPRPNSELQDFQSILRETPMGAGDDMFRFVGVGECVTWGMYNNDDPSPAQVAQFEDVALWAARAGLGLTVHWNEDRSIPHLLGALERVAAQVDIRPLRWSIAHVHDARVETLARMRALGVGWLMQDRLLFAAPAFLARYDEARRASLPPLVAARRMGLPVGGGTDADRVMSYNPFRALQWMLDGRTLAGQATRGAAETPMREEALRIWTQGGAWFTQDDGKRGALEPGKLADFAVLAADPLTAPLEELADIRALLTVVGGRVVYAEAPFAR